MCEIELANREISMFGTERFFCRNTRKTDAQRIATCSTENENQLKEELIPKGITVLLVLSTREIFAFMPAIFFGYPVRQLMTIGITGTNEKTTTAYMIWENLEKAGKKAGLIGTLRVFIDGTKTGTRNTKPKLYEIHHLLTDMIKAGCQYAVMGGLSGAAIKPDGGYQEIKGIN